MSKKIYFEFHRMQIKRIFILSFIVIFIALPMNLKSHVGVKIELHTPEIVKGGYRKCYGYGPIHRI